MAHISSSVNKNETMAENEVTAVKQIKSTILSQMINPFACRNDSDLLKISTGGKASSTELINAKERGMELLQEAQEQNYEKVKNYKIQTFAEKNIRNQSKAKQVQQLYKEEASVTRSLYFMDSLSDDEKVKSLSHELTQYPPALFEPNEEIETGYQMRSGNKAEFIGSLKKSLGDQWAELECLPDDQSESDTIYVIDAMAFIQRQQTLGSRTFGELQSEYKKKVLNQRPQNCHYVHFVGDRYDVPASKSLKLETRKKRDAKKIQREYEVDSLLEIPDWKKFITNGKNKSNLLNFIGESWIADRAGLPDDVNLIIGGILNDPGKTVLINDKGCEVLPDLSCSSHEEADNRMFAHLNFSASRSHGTRAVLQTIDTDVIVMSMYYCVRIPNVNQLWVQKAQTYLPIHMIVRNHATVLQCDPNILTGILLNTYILTGCDTVSFIFNKSKSRVLKAATEQVNNLLEFGRYGEEEGVGTEAAMAGARLLFKCLYGRPDFNGNLNMLRAHLFATTGHDLRFLPPTEDAFAQHVLRACMQITLNKSSHLSAPNYPDPTQFGRHIVSGILVPVMMQKSPKPVRTTKQVYCKCKKGRCLQRCSCAKQSISCTVGCLCGGDPQLCGRAVQSLFLTDSSDGEGESSMDD